MRKIYEAYVINYFKPEINDKDECISVKTFLVNYQFLISLVQFILV